MINVIGINRMKRVVKKYTPDDLLAFFWLYKIGFTRNEIQRMIDENTASLA
jgi:hypothetical protein